MWVKFGDSLTLKANKAEISVSKLHETTDRTDSKALFVVFCHPCAPLHFSFSILKTPLSSL